MWAADGGEHLPRNPQLKRRGGRLIGPHDERVEGRLREKAHRFPTRCQTKDGPRFEPHGPLRKAAVGVVRRASLAGPMVVRSTCRPVQVGHIRLSRHSSSPSSGSRSASANVMRGLAHFPPAIRRDASLSRARAALLSAPARAFRSRSALRSSALAADCGRPNEWPLRAMREIG